MRNASYLGTDEVRNALAIGVCALVLGMIAWRILRRRWKRRRWRRGKAAPADAGSRSRFAEAGDPKAAFDYVYIGQDGSPRELSPEERAYLTTPFDPGDGARPYVKPAYESRNGWGSLAGFLAREKVPAGVRVSAVNPDYDRELGALARIPIERLGSFTKTKKALLEHERMRDAIARKGLD